MVAEALTTALLSLGCVNSYNCCNNYNINHEALNEVINENYRYGTVNYIEDVYNLVGENQYLEIIIDDDWLIIDKRDYNIVETKNKTEDPYKDFDGFKIFNESNYDCKYFGYKNNKIIDLSNNNIVNFDDISFDAIKSETMPAKSDYEKKQDDNFYYGNMKYCNNYSYFEKLDTNHHAENNGNSCGPVATEILLAYYDTFLNDNIIEEKYENNVMGYFESIDEFYSSPGVDNYSDREFHDYLYNFSDGHSKDEGFSNKELNKMLKKYLDNYNFKYSLNYSLEDNLSALTETKAIKIIKKTIDEGRPLIASTYYHFMVAYAYNDDYVYLHSGWGYVVRMKWKFFKSELVYNNWYNPFSLEVLCAGALDVKFNVNHVHSDNYYSKTLGTAICYCGEKHNHNETIKSLDTTSHLSECSCGLYQKESHHFCVVLSTKEYYSILFRRYINIPILDEIYCDICNYNKREG